MKHGSCSLHGLGAMLLACMALSLIAACGERSPSPVDAAMPDGASPGDAADAPVVCGGAAGQTCSSAQYCDFATKLCGGDETTGTCKPRPTTCPFLFDPVCACDGMTYQNGCEAALQGHDVSALANCPPPQNGFSCGFRFCVVGQAYCQHTHSDVAGVADDYTCRPLPAGCSDAPGCACLADEPCGTLCAEDEGNYTLTCAGG